MLALSIYNDLIKANIHKNVALISCLLLSSCSTMVDKDLTSKEIKKELEKSDNHHISLEKKRLEKKQINIKMPKVDITELLKETSVLDKKFTINVRNIPVKSIIYSLAKDGGIQLDLHPIKNKRITLMLKDVPLRYVLDKVSEQAGLIYFYKQGVLTIKDDVPTWSSFKVDYVNISFKSSGSASLNMSIGSNSVPGSQLSSGGKNSSDINVTSEQDFWKQIETDVSNLVGNKEEGKNIIINKEAGVISVFANSRIKKQVEKYLKTILRRLLKQVLIEATVVEVELNKEFKAGIDWSKLQVTNGSQNQLSTSYPFHIVSDPVKNTIANNFNFDFGISFLQRFGKTKVLSTPKIMAINNQTAMLKVVDNKVYFTIEVQSDSNANTTTTTYQTTVHTVPVGFMMTLTPFVGDNEDILLYVRPTLSRILGYEDDPNPSLASAGVRSRIPIIQEREISSTLKLKDGQIAILGGLMQSEKIGDDSSLPGVGEISGLGELFHHYDNSREKTELVIFIRPKIVTNPSVETDLKMFKSQLSN